MKIYLLGHSNSTIKKTMRQFSITKVKVNKYVIFWHEYKHERPRFQQDFWFGSSQCHSDIMKTAH